MYTNYKFTACEHSAIKTLYISILLVWYLTASGDDTIGINIRNIENIETINIIEKEMNSLTREYEELKPYRKTQDRTNIDEKTNALLNTIVNNYNLLINNNIITDDDTKNSFLGIVSDISKNIVSADEKHNPEEPIQIYKQTFESEFCKGDTRYENNYNYYSKIYKYYQDFLENLKKLKEQQQQHS